MAHEGGDSDYGAYDVAPDPSDDWYYADGSDRQGPIGLDDMRRMIRDRTLAPDQLVWRAGMNDWLPAQQVPALMPSFGHGSPQAAHPGAPPGNALNYQSQPTPYNPQGGPDRLAGQATAAMTLGILSIVFSCCGVIGLILGILALVQGSAAKESTTRAGQAQAGWICGLIGTILSVASCGFNAIGIFV